MNQKEHMLKSKQLFKWYLKVSFASQGITSNNQILYNIFSSFQTNRDLQERVKALNDIIGSLEVKIEELSRANGDNTAGLLQKLRDGTNAELRRYKQEAG